RTGQGRGRPPRRPRRRPRARGPAARDDGQRGAPAAGGPARAVPALVRGHAGARGSRPRTRRARSRPRRRAGRHQATLTRPTVPATGLTRFAPAPTGWLHLGHVAAAAWVWGVAATTGRRVLLRIEDHDRQRARPADDAAVLEDLAWLGFVADLGPVRQSDGDAEDAYAAAAERLRA